MPGLPAFRDGREAVPIAVNILFICYGGHTSNSFNHITGFARELEQLGHCCVTALPTPEPGPADHWITHAELIARPSCFPDGRSADLIHAWTPRIAVLRCLLACQRRVARPARVAVHLEDNERHLLAHTTGAPFDSLLDWPEQRLRPFLRKGLAHPSRHQLLLGVADLITGIIPSLVELSPPGAPFAAVRPGVDLQMFSPRPPDPALRSQLGVRTDERVIVYPGGANLTNADELRTLYAAVVLLNRAGSPTRLIRTGPAAPWFVARLSPEERACALELGFVSRDRLPGLLALADVLVQPGRADAFNDYRLPSKLAEFLASGRPAILPPTNLAHAMQDGREALFLRDGSPEDIQVRCLQVFANPQLAAGIGAAGRRFAESYFDPRANTAALSRLYEETLARPATADWTRLRTRFSDEADLFPLSIPRPLPPALLLLAKKRRARRLIVRMLGRLFPPHRVLRASPEPS
jgi:glycosyltransferase involved in cell wall biosynthesis